MSNLFAEHSSIRFTKDFADQHYNIPKGTTGTIVHVYPQNTNVFNNEQGYAVELSPSFDCGDMIGVVDVPHSFLEARMPGNQRCPHCNTLTNSLPHCNHYVIWGDHNYATVHPLDEGINEAFGISESDALERFVYSVDDDHLIASSGRVILKIASFDKWAAWKDDPSTSLDYSSYFIAGVCIREYAATLLNVFSGRFPNPADVNIQNFESKLKID